MKARAGNVEVETNIDNTKWKLNIYYNFTDDTMLLAERKTLTKTDKQILYCL